jgi:hypothetical protein
MTSVSKNPARSRRGVQDKLANMSLADKIKYILRNPWTIPLPSVSYEDHFAEWEKSRRKVWRRRCLQGGEA